MYLLRYKALKDAYANRKDEEAHFKCKTRGFAPKEIERPEGVSYNQAVSEVLSRDIPELWRQGVSTYKFMYTIYLGLGISSVSEKSWKRLGWWVKKERELRLDMTEGKRVAISSDGKRKSRAVKLVNLDANRMWFADGVIAQAL